MPASAGIGTQITLRSSWLHCRDSVGLEVSWLRSEASESPNLMRDAPNRYEQLYLPATSICENISAPGVLVTLCMSTMPFLMSYLILTSCIRVDGVFSFFLSL